MNLNLSYERSRVMPEMKISVVLHDGEKMEVKSFQLDKLMSLGRVEKFRRSGRWVTVGKDPVRSKERNYNGPERRNHSTIKLL